MACLAGVLIIVSYNMSEWRTFKALLKNPKADVAVLLATFLLTVIFDLVVAIQVGLLLAALLFMKRVAETTTVSVNKEKIKLTEDYGPDYQTDDDISIPKDVEVYEIEGPFFFGIANRFEELMITLKDKPQVRIFRMRKVPFIDSTGIKNLKTLCLTSHKQGIKIVLSGVTPSVYRTLEMADFKVVVGDENICPNIYEAIKRAEDIIQSSKQEI
jgi:sulfate permease, SulP family